MKEMTSRLLAILLALALVLPFSLVFSAEESDSSPPAEAQATVQEGLSEEEIQTADLKKQIVPASEVPDLIDYDIAVAEKYVCRAYWEETSLNEVVFLKSDGSLVRYVFSFPVKYESDGEIYDKQPALEERETLLDGTYRYQLAPQNDTALYCAENLSDGFLFQGEDLQINLRPITKDQYDFLRGHISAGAIAGPMGGSFQTYDSVAVTGVGKSALSVATQEATAALYALSSSGQQASYAAVQDTLAVVPSYTGFQLQLTMAQGELYNTLYFALEAQDLTLVRSEDLLLLLDRQGNSVGILGDALSQDGQAYAVDYAVAPLDEDLYLLSVTLPRTTQNSAYTLSFTLDYDDLVDATIYTDEDYKDRCYPNSQTLWVGYYPETGFESALIRPAAWNFTENTAPSQVITNARMVLRDVTVTSQEATIECRRFLGNAWEESTACWNTVNGAAVGPFLDSNAVSSSIGWDEGYYYSFDVTELVQNWYDGTVSWQKGAIFTWRDAVATEMEKGFASTEYSREAYRPQLVVEYAQKPTISDGVYYIESAIGGYLSVEEERSVDFDLTPSNISSSECVNVVQRSQKNSAIDALNLTQLWRVTYVENGYYAIRPYHYTPAGLYANGTNAIVYYVGYNDAQVNSEALWKISFDPNTNDFYLQFFGGGGLCLENNYWGGSGGNITVGDIYRESYQRWNFEIVEDAPKEAIFYDPDSNLREQSPTRVIGYLEEKLLFGDLNIDIALATLGNIDPYSYAWESQFPSIAEINRYTFAITGLTEGRSTEICMKWADADYDPGFVLHVSAAVNEGIYYIQNARTLRYVDVENQLMQNGTIIHQWSFHGGASSRWDVEYCGDGYYTIRSMFTDSVDYYLAVANSSSTENVSVVLQSGTITDGMKWKFVRTDSGSYKIIPKVGVSANLVMGVEDSSNDLSSLGLDMESVVYTDDGVDTDEWFMRNLEDSIEDDFLNQGLVSFDDIVSTDDGFTLILKPLSDIFLQSGINELHNNDDTNQGYNVSLYYDDWYIFFVRTSAAAEYGILKMREAESDGGDIDDAGVTIPFLSLDIDLLQSCLSLYTKSKGALLFEHIEVLTRKTEIDGRLVPYSSVICSHFWSPFSDAPYLIAEKYVEKIANTHDSQNRVRVPADYIGLLSDSDDRLEDFVLEIDPHGEICVINDNSGYIQLSDPDHLTTEEFYVILALYTGDVSLNCFAAEVWYHAGATRQAYNYYLSDVYEKALRADLTTLEGYYNDFVDVYHDESDGMVWFQARIHGAR